MEIIFKNVTLYKSHYCCETRKVLDKISFHLKPNNIYAFVGKSGCGKTSICELIDFLEAPNRGYIKVGNYINDGSKRNLNKIRVNIGYVYKRPKDMFVCSTVREELAFGLKNFKYKSKNKNKRILDSLKMVGLDEKYLDLDPLKLDLNDQKKVALASVLTFNPKILIIDEPSVGLNYREKNELIRLLKRLKDKYKRTIILMSKDTDFIYSFIDYVYIIDNGVLVREGKKNILTEIKMLKKYEIKIPDIVSFTNTVRECGHKLQDYDNVKDLIKGVYRSAR